MTNTGQYTGTHRTDEPFGVVIKTHPHPHGVINRTAGQINARAWRMAADAIRSDLATRAALRAIPTASPMHWNTCKICQTSWASMTPSDDCGSQDQQHRTARGQ